MEFGGFCGGLWEKQRRQRGGGCFPLRCDVTVKADVETLVESVMSRFGWMDTLVNVAGLIGESRRKRLQRRITIGCWTLISKGPFG